MSYHEMMADREEAYALGADQPERAWVLTDRDVWHRNPFYKGPEVRHPEDDSDDDCCPVFNSLSHQDSFLDDVEIAGPKVGKAAVEPLTLDDFPF